MTLTAVFTTNEPGDFSREYQQHSGVYLQVEVIHQEQMLLATRGWLNLNAWGPLRLIREESSKFKHIQY